MHYSTSTISGKWSVKSLAYQVYWPLEYYLLNVLRGYLEEHLVVVVELESDKMLITNGIDMIKNNMIIK